MDVPFATLAAFSEALLACYAASSPSAGIEALIPKLRDVFAGAEVSIAPSDAGAAAASDDAIVAREILVLPVEGTPWLLTLRRTDSFSAQERLFAQMLSAHLARVLLRDQFPSPWHAPLATANASWNASELGLTAREAEVLRWIAAGKRDAQIAELIGAAPRTVGKHVENILRKLGAETRGAAAIIAEERLTGP